MTGTLYIASLLAEANPIKSLEGKLRDFVKVYQSLRHWNFCRLWVQRSTCIDS